MIRQSKIVVFVNRANLHIFKKCEDHQHSTSCLQQCVGFQEEQVIDIESHRPKADSLIGGLLLLTSANTSQDFNYICCSDNQKNVYIFRWCGETNSWSLIHLFQLKIRALSKVQFDKGMKYVVMTDKSGDVYITEIQLNHEENTMTSDEPKKILGHCSFITDTILTEDEKFILTADRDHKIRMSHFPFGCDIERFFLAHTDPVHFIQLLKHEKSPILISVSQAGNIILWEWKPETNDWKQYDMIKALSLFSCIDLAEAGTVATVHLKNACTTNDSKYNSIINIAIQLTNETGGIMQINLKEPNWNESFKLLGEIRSIEHGSNELVLFDGRFILYNCEKNAISLFSMDN